MRKVTFTEGEIYHIYNRGVEKRSVFLDDQDHFRFVHNLFEFNNEEPARNLFYKKPSFQNLDLNQPIYETKSRKLRRKLIVEILMFVLMPNHFHLLLKQRKENGITEFMHKLGVGYTMYFNQKYQRTGSLFQGTFKAVLVKREAHFIHLPYYLHLNPLALKFPGWRQGKVADRKEAMKFLEQYRWSSYPDYIGIKNFPSVTSRDFLLNYFGKPEKHKKDIFEWLQEAHEESVREHSLEYSPKSQIYET
ncbi:transposase [Candidatus Azambacteria bacterium]|nr:transposase [Candidatus Azambacteria bacterium]MBI3685375.1 transposase [Candidatus Azambacteria bacterium]